MGLVVLRGRLPGKPGPSLQLPCAESRIPQLHADRPGRRAMTSKHYDCIVAGTGGVGSAALFHLARRGLKVLGLDRFPPGHDRGSSHGDTRVIRLAYFEHPDYVPLLKRAYQLWAALAERRGQRLYHETGLLQLTP